MKKNYTKFALVSSLALSIALLAVPQANAGVFSHLKSIAQDKLQKAAKKVVTVASDPKVKKAVLGAGAAVGGAFMAKKATSETETPMAAE